MLYGCVKTMANMKTAMYCFTQHTHAPISKTIKQQLITISHYAALPTNSGN